jgi:glycosyltransferase involved in cell wall biosynthesis
VNLLLKILLLSAYDADSHQYWRKGLVANFSEYNWTVLTLPGRYFSWRIRGNSMSWAFGEYRETLLEQYDLVIATSMTDLSALRGFIPSLANTPTILYFHENQFAYPATAQARNNVEPLILNLYSALAANKLIFNSHYNLNTFFQGAQKLLKKLPDQVPANLIALLKSKASVLPVPLMESDPQLSGCTTTWDKYQDISHKRRPMLIVWAARWEYDKGPDRLLAIVVKLSALKIDFKIAILGQSFRQRPEQFEKLNKHYGQYIDQIGFADSKSAYQTWLNQADFFLSTAVHEFQGLSVLEAVQAKCYPILPNRLVYPELFDPAYLYTCNEDIKIEAKSAVELILNSWKEIQKQANTPLQIDMQWSDYSDKYKKIIESLVINQPA